MRTVEQYRTATSCNLWRTKFWTPSGRNLFCTNNCLIHSNRYIHFLIARSWFQSVQTYTTYSVLNTPNPHNKDVTVVFLHYTWSCTYTAPMTQQTLCLSISNSPNSANILMPTSRVRLVGSRRVDKNFIILNLFLKWRESTYHRNLLYSVARERFAPS